MVKQSSSALSTRRLKGCCWLQILTAAGATGQATTGRDGGTKRPAKPEFSGEAARLLGSLEGGVASSGNKAVAGQPNQASVPQAPAGAHAASHASEAVHGGTAVQGGVVAEVSRHPAGVISLQWSPMALASGTILQGLLVLGFSPQGLRFKCLALRMRP